MSSLIFLTTKPLMTQIYSKRKESAPTGNKFLVIFYFIEKTLYRGEKNNKFDRFTSPERVSIDLNPDQAAFFTRPC